MKTSRSYFSLLFLLMIMLVSCGIHFHPIISSPGIQFVHLPENLYSLNAYLSPDGNNIVMTANKRWDQTYPVYVYVFNIQSKELKKIPTIAQNLSPLGTFGEGDMAWSPDGTMLAIAGGPSDRLDLSGIWLLNWSDYSMERVTSGDTMSWSPNGDRLAIIETTPITHSIIKIVNIQDHVEHVIYEFDHEEEFLLKIDWSPTGEELIIGVPGSNSRGYAWGRLYRLNIDGSSFAPFLENSSWSLRNPTWLPNGTWIAFTADTGSRTVTIASISGKCLFPWLPTIGDAIMISISKDGKKALVVTMWDLFLVDLEKAVPFDLLPENLKCP
jgi:Tol biopolymer transport system component